MGTKSKRENAVTLIFIIGWNTTFKFGKQSIISFKNKRNWTLLICN